MIKVLRRNGATATSLILALAATILQAPSGNEPALAQEVRPNVVIIVTDDQRAGTLGVMPETSRWFAERGVRFRNAFVTTPLCCPSRASILTGQYAHNHGVRTNADAERIDPASTLPRYLHDAGYRSAIYGKYLNGWEAVPPYFDTSATHIRGPRYVGGTWNVDGVETTIDEYSTDYIGRQAVEFLERTEDNDDDPFFLYLAPSAPHTPYTSSPEDAGAPVPRWEPNVAVMEEDRSDKPPYVREQSFAFWKARFVRRQQLRTLISLDDVLGDVFDALARLRERSRTLAFFVSDNGYMWGEHGLLGPSISKNSAYTHSIRIPFLMWWPHRLLGGVVDSRLVSLSDIAPTVLDAVGLSPDATRPMDGMSLLRARTRRRVLTEHWEEPPKPTPAWASVRTASFQYIEYYGVDGQTVTFSEYYDLNSDPWQLRNLLHDRDPTNNPDISLLHALVQRDRSCVGAACP